MRCLACSAEVPESARYCPACAQPVGSVSQHPTGLATPSVAEAALRRGASDSPVGRFASSPSLDGGGFAPGTILAERYRIIGLVGRGGMGEVYRADDLKLGQPVALKFLPAKLASEPAWIERFYAEVRHARGVSHPNVCRVYDVGEIGGRHFLSMEYVDGEDLASLLRRIGRLPPDKAVEIAHELCAGLAAAHDKGVLHRDLKPSNVMIDGRGRAKITDFGLAVGVEDDKGGAEVSGTPAYMAPEQLSGKGASIQSDIYALGLVLYEVFTGRKAFDAATLADWRRKHSEDQPTAPSTVTPGLDPVVERVILRCLEKDPKARPRSVAAVAAALPGGDPLAAAIAAGETPSPEMVAAAGSDEGMKPAAAWACLSAALVGMLLTAYLTPRVALPGAVHLEKSPEVLAERSRQVIQKLGYTEKPVDSARGFDNNVEYLRWVKEHDPSPARWKDLAGGRPAGMFFWYRQSPAYLVPLSIATLTLVSEDDPPPSTSGMAAVRLDPQGRLITFEAVPPQVEGTPTASSPPDWSPLFTEAGLDPAKFSPTTPERLPPTYADARMAWVESRPERTDRPFRIEAAAYRGKLVYFELLGPWSRPARMGPPEQSAARKAEVLLLAGVLLTVSLGGVLIARRNLRLGRGDRRGALRLATFVLGCALLSFPFDFHFVPSATEVFIIFTIASLSLGFAALTWVGYIALEPIIRRRWPDTLISWTRFLSGRFRDPLVGRAILVAAVLGTYGSLSGCLEYLVRARLEPAPPSPYHGFDSTLLGIGPLLASLISFPAGSLLITVAFVLVFFVLRAVLRKDVVAVVVFVLVLSVPDILAGGWISGVFGLVYVAAQIFAFLRFGLLPLVFAGIFKTSLNNYLTLDPSLWYFGPSLFLLAVLAALAVYGFRIALAGRPMFSGMRLED
jgi:serine/threonine-protein kinase